ncbi:MAG: hypothetical protein ABSH46_16780 [Bryobacteraceae bacterium]|jgi:hypothetical protein
MKPTIAVLVSSLAVALAAPPKAELTQVHKVYLLPMTNGLEQYLANRLTSLGVFQVVTDPKKADAIFTDRIGEAFESRQTEWFPERPAKPASDEKAPPAPPEVAAPAQPPAAAVQPLPAPGTSAAQPPAPATPTAAPPASEKQPPPSPPQEKAAASEPEKQGDTAPLVSSFHRSKGTLFLVDPHSRMVLWSIYAQPRDASPVQLDRTAGRIASRIQQDLKSH